MPEHEERTASSAIWAVAMIVIVAMIIGAILYTGVLTKNQKKEIDIDVSVPSR